MGKSCLDQLKPATRSTRLYSSGLTTEVRFPAPFPRISSTVKAFEHSPHLGTLCGFVLRILAADKLRIDNNPLAIWSRIANIVRSVVSMRTVFYVSTAVHWLLMTYVWVWSHLRGASIKIPSSFRSSICPSVCLWAYNARTKRKLISGHFYRKFSSRFSFG